MDKIEQLKHEAFMEALDEMKEEHKERVEYYDKLKEIEKKKVKEKSPGGADASPTST